MMNGDIPTIRLGIVTFLGAALIILTRSYLAGHGYLTADSHNFLSLAQTLLENGNFMVNSPAGQKERVFFAVWPIGYPSLIYLLSKITTLPVFLSSKLLNILLIGFLFVVFLRVYKRDAYLFFPIIFLAPSIEIFTFSISEAPFIIGMFLFALVLSDILKSENVSITQGCTLFLTIMLLFFSRYIGIFTLGLLGLASLLSLATGQYKKMLIMICTFLLSLAVISVYLYYNYKVAGYITGMPRGTKPFIDFNSFFLMVARGLLAELNLLVLGLGATLKSTAVYVITFSLQLFLFYKLLKTNTLDISFNKKYLQSSGCIFIFVGCFYLLAIIAARTISYFGILNFKYLFPGSFLILLGLIQLIKDSHSVHQKVKFFYVFFAVAILSATINISRPVIKHMLYSEKHITYTQMVKNLRKKVAHLRPGSVVIFGDRNLSYLRPDLSIASPFYVPFFAEKESWKAFLSRIEKKYKDREVYVMIKGTNFWEYTREKDLLEIYHPSVVNFIFTHKDRDLFKL